MKRLQILAYIWETLRHFVPGEEHKRQELARHFAREVLDRPDFFDRQYFYDEGEHPGLVDKAEVALIALRVHLTIEKYR